MSFNRALQRGIEALTSHDSANSFHDEIDCGMSCCRPDIHHPHLHLPSLLGFVPWHDDPHF